MVIEQEFLNRMIGQKIKFDVYEEYMASTEFRDKTEFKRMPLIATKATPIETVLEQVTYDHVLQIFTLNSIYKTRSFTINE